MVNQWAIYSVCDVALGIGKIVRESSEAAEISYGDNRFSEIYSHECYSSYGNIRDAVFAMKEIEGGDFINGLVNDLLLAFPSERKNLEKILDD